MAAGRTTTGPDRADGRLLSGLMVLGVVGILVLAAWAGVDHGCRVSPPPLDGPPDPGTPRAGYCDALGGAFRWIGLVVLPALVVVATTAAFHRRVPLLPRAVALLVCTLALANWLWFEHLDWALTI